MIRKPSPLGLALSGLFLIYSAYIFLATFQGAWQAPFFIIVATFPFSMLINHFMDWLQDLFFLSPQIGSLVEVSINGIFGMIEFYAIGYLIERVVCRESKEVRLDVKKK